ncbi:serine hydrolase [Paenibacillus sambharensis]|uniref:Serine hydrolase n=1 Tax=Paenibacillus sambharensis TaxID=1803190 RepID=A0A2W1LA09_9BACL|nr:serine hydrolase [Paenibacillus sambharensis]PZD96076.1 serine hydrolase [Paenibacillus sambharensis]
MIRSHTAGGSIERAEAAVSGLDTDKLNEMNDTARQYGMRSVLIVKDGRIAWEWHEQGTDRIGSVYSCTKSVLSALIGIALDEGHIRSVDDRAAGYLKLQGSLEEHPVTIKQLLTMTPGYDWPDFDKPYKEMKKAEDWVQYVLDRPLVHTPGEVFTYNSGGSHLLSAVLTSATGTSTLSYAREKLFGPLGIRRLKWGGQHGIQEGGAGLYLTAEDLAKLGMLFANQGVWEGNRLLSAGWIEESTRSHSKGLVNYRPSIYGNYGYHWWVSAEQPEEVPPYYFAFGYGGQYMAVVPEYNAVVVLRKNLAGRNKALLSRRILHEYIFSSLTGKTCNIIEG